MLHAFATGLFSLNCFRFLLGLGEAGNWPGAAKVIAEWFPIRQRALGMAIFNSGTSIGSVVAPPVIIALATALRLADHLPRRRRAGLPVARAVAGVLLPARPPPPHHARRTGAHPRGSRARCRLPLLVRTAALSPDLGHRALPLLLRPRVVALHYLAAALSIQGSRLQPQTNRPLRLGALCRRRRRQPVRRLDVAAI